MKRPARNISRRHLIADSAALAAGLALSAQAGAESSAAAGPFMAMGFRIGEVTGDSAVIWMRTTASRERNWNGVKPAAGNKDKTAGAAPDPTPSDQFEGATPGAPGEVRVAWSASPDLSGAQDSGWLAAQDQADFTAQFTIKDLKPAAQYHLRVQARPSGGSQPTAESTGSFTTAAPADQWQNVKFGVVTCQGYRDLDDPQGYHIYDAMKKLGLNFFAQTGDNVYYDSDQPYARSIGLARLHWQRMYSLPRHIELFRTVPCYFQKDDHDAYFNDFWPGMKAKPLAPFTWEEGLRVFKEQVPHGPLPYRTIRWGRGLQIWLTEGRDYRSPNTMPDGPDKSIWGKRQRDWLMNSIEQSDALFRVLISPTPIVGPDRGNKGDNHSNRPFQFEGDLFRQWAGKLKNFYVTNGDRHWQYHSVDPKTRVREFSCGPASDAHASGTPGEKPEFHKFHRVAGGFLTFQIALKNKQPTITVRFHDVQGKVHHQFMETASA